MGSWCAENLRDSKAFAGQGLALTACSDEAVKLFDCSLRQLVSWIDCEQMGGLEATLTRMHGAEPEFLMGRAFQLGLNAFGTVRSIRADPTFGPELEKLVADAMARGNSREQKHAKAVQLFADSEMASACVEWEKILAEYPNDLMALKFAHDAYFFTGDCRARRDCFKNVIDKWDKNAPCYSYLHGMYAFGLEECGQYGEAERLARAGLALQPRDCWSSHALAHCFEMASDFGQGIHFMESTEADWAPCNYLACHNYWHLALFKIEKGDFESAMSIFDDQIAERTRKSGTIMNAVDSASLLCRFQMEGKEPGRERWESLLALVEPRIEDHIVAFNDVHISLVLGQLGEKHLVEKHTKSMAKFAKTAKGDNARIMRDLGTQLCDSIVAFDGERFEQAFDGLYPIRTQIYRIGGSDAQRDVFTQMLIHAGLRCEDAERRNKTLGVIQEREKNKPKSTVTERLLQRHQETMKH